MLMIHIEIIIFRISHTYIYIFTFLIPAFAGMTNVNRYQYQDSFPSHFGECEIIFPGFKTLLGSQAALIFRIASRAGTSIIFSKKPFLARPTPCSPVMVPPSLIVSSYISSKAFSLLLITILYYGS